MQNTLENLELKLAQSRKEQAEQAEKVEKDFSENYESFLKGLFEGDFLGAKRYLSAYFQIEKINNPEKTDKEIFTNAVEKSVEILPLTLEKKNNLAEKIIKLSEKKEFITEKMTDHSDLQKDIHFPILESLQSHNILTQEDLVNLSLSYKKTKNIQESLQVLDGYKREIVKSNIFEVSGVSENTKVEHFKNDFREEIEASQMMTFYPKVLKFVGRNYSRLRLKNKVESKKERLRRMFKIAFLKLYRLKYSGIDISSILQKIETLESLDELLSLLIKFFEVLKQNPQLSQDYVVLDEIDTVSEIQTEAEENKEKSLFAEEKIIKASSLVEETENALTAEDLDTILSEEVDLVGEEFIMRTGENAGVLAENNDGEEDDEEDEGEEKEADLDALFEELKQKLFELEEKKRKLFLAGEYDEIDELNDELVDLIKKLEKLKKLLNKEEE